MNVVQLVHSHHRNVHNFNMNISATMGAYCFLATKPKYISTSRHISPTVDSSYGNKHRGLQAVIQNHLLA